MDEVEKHTSLFEQDTFVTVALESSEDTFCVSKALLCSASDYFKTALNGKFKESKENTLRLPGCTVQVFRLFRYYLSQKTLPSFELPAQLTDILDKHKFYMESQDLLVRLWIFAEEHLMPPLQNVAMERIREVLRSSVPQAGVVSFAFEHTTCGSILRDVLSRQVALYVKYGSYTEEDAVQLGGTKGVLLQIKTDHRLPEKKL